MQIISAKNRKKQGKNFFSVQKSKKIPSCGAKTRRRTEKFGKIWCFLKESASLFRLPPVGRRHGLLDQRFCLRGQRPLASRLDPAAPFYSLLPPQAALVNVSPPTVKRQTVVPARADTIRPYEKFCSSRRRGGYQPPGAGTADCVQVCSSALNVK